ncbi:MAG: hypothetical protein ACP5JJ_09100, partial [Anaerolineae bacterium]
MALIRKQRRLVSLILVWMALSGMCLLIVVGASAQPPCPVPLDGRQRYGFAAFSANWPEKFAIDQLKAGWAVDHVRVSNPPAGMDRAMVIGTKLGSVPDASTLGRLVDANPGAIWIIGNEPDCIWQDNRLPEEYARVYHDLYVFIKSRDQTSQVAAGGIVQPTPLRLQYLDLVLEAYQARYGHALPVDIWHIHNAILNEVSCDFDPTNCWGAEIPPGIDAPHGVFRTGQDNDNLDYFRGQVWA